MAKRLARFLRDERGATAIEYGLIAGIVSITIVLAVTGIGNSLQNKFLGPVTNGLR